MFAEYPILCMITAGRLSAAAHRDDAATLLMRIAAAAKAGISIVQIREPLLDTRGLAALVRAARRTVDGTPAHIVVNDRLDVAVATGAQGVHLKEASLSASRVRAIAPPPFLIGRSIHDDRDAADPDADYLVFGTVFDTPSKPGVRGAGVQALQAVVSRSRAPVLAIGGVSDERVPQLRAAGAAGFAAIGYFDVEPSLIGERCARARRLFDSQYRVS